MTAVKAQSENSAFILRDRGYATIDMHWLGHALEDDIEVNTYWRVVDPSQKTKIDLLGALIPRSKIKTGLIEVRFNQTGKGLKSRDNQPLRRFEIAGKAGVWIWAKAVITAPDTISISSDEIGEPVAVRYAWAANPEGANLVNSKGRPTSFFRTDD